MQHSEFEGFYNLFDERGSGSNESGMIGITIGPPAITPPDDIKGHKNPKSRMLHFTPEILTCRQKNEITYSS